jgi:HlyD family secretion protein
MNFNGNEPEGIRRGQTLRLRLELGDLSQAVLVHTGGFFQTTGGRWIYVLDESGAEARRRRIHLGRQNTEYYEVLDGLVPGERVIISSYDTFGEVDRLVLK